MIYGTGVIMFRVGQDNDLIHAMYSIGKSGSLQQTSWPDSKLKGEGGGGWGGGGWGWGGVGGGGAGTGRKNKISRPLLGSFPN